ncbi:Potassium transporter [Sarracenia purpurea var. burkii]
MDHESSPSRNRLKLYKRTLCLAYQSFGVVYGDLSTSPIYVYKSTFSGSLRPYREDHEILGVLSLIFWTLTLIPLCKYTIFVLAADDNGEGGTFALYSLLCRRLKAGLSSTSHITNDRMSSYNTGTSTKDTRTSLLIKNCFEKHPSSRVVLLLVVFLGTSMVIGDGILTPTMSVLSAVNGIRIMAPNLHGSYIVLIACVILIAFMVVVYPCLVLAYMGEAAYLSKNRMDLQSSFFKAIPGLAVITVMFVTTCLMFLIISSVWNRTVIEATMFVLIFGSIELLYFSACLGKVNKGGWLPILFSLVILFLMVSWQYGTSKKQAFELDNKVSLERLSRLGPSLGVVRVPGIALVYASLAATVPPMFAHFVTNFPAFHQFVIFVTLESLTVPNVPVSDRILAGRIGPPDLRAFWCIVRYGYKDARDSYSLETQLIEKVAEFLQSECHSEESAVNGYPSAGHEDGIGAAWRRNTNMGSKNQGPREEVKDQFIEAREVGVAYMLGNAYIVASEASPIIKKFVINAVYGFLRCNCRRPAIALGIPYTSLIEVGMVYRV